MIHSSVVIIVSAQHVVAIENVAIILKHTKTWVYLWVGVIKDEVRLSAERVCLAFALMQRFAAV